MCIKKLLKLFAVNCIFLFVIYTANSPVYALEKIEVTTVDPVATGYGTFQSHNQKVVSNQYGIFMTHLHARTEAYVNNTWRLSRSIDGGVSFSTVYEAANTINAPTLESDPNGVLYAMRTKDDGNAELLRFSPSNNFSAPETVANLSGGSAQKFAMVLDWPRRTIYYASTPGLPINFYSVSLTGEIKQTIQITKEGTSASAHYPLLYLDASGTLYFAWTTVKHGEYMYWDIHFMLSKDGGVTWQKPDGTVLSLPVVSDETGPTDRITLDDEFNVHTWLWSLLVKNGKAYFPYEAQSNPAKQHMVRFDLTTGKKDKDIYPDWKGETISLLNLDGFCATDSQKTQSPLFCLSRTRDGKLGALVSYDNGDSWHDYALSDYTGENYYSIGGAREITDDGYIIGSYTDGRTANAVRFFRVKTAFGSTPTSTPTPRPTATPTPKPTIRGDLNHDDKVDIFDYNLLVGNFGKTGTVGWIPADINADGKVDIFDYNILVGNFGKTQ